MNEKDVTLMADIMSELERPDECRRILLSVNYKQINRINLILLRALLSQQGKRGLLVTVDRPHQYMSYLLTINKVPQGNLEFLDLISRFSGEGLACDGDKESGLSPFCINDLITMLENGGGRNDARASGVDFGLMDFVMIDNIGALLAYNDVEDVAAFIHRYLRLIVRYGRIFTAVVLDVRSHPQLYSTIQGLCQKEFIVTDDGEMQPLVAEDAQSGGDGGDVTGNDVVESAIVLKPGGQRKASLFARPWGAT